jgi:predicted  nucleic acid-binding Zn-ribbon protein
VPLLAPLLDLQALDLECDRLRRQRETLPERAELARAVDEIASIEAAIAARQGELDELTRAEREVAADVTSMASRASEVETNLYSGTVSVAKELEALQEELGSWVRKKTDAEDRELALLEQIESTEAQLAACNHSRTTVEERVRSLEGKLDDSESVIDRAIAELEEQGAGLRAGLPRALLDVYDRLRLNPRLAGRAAVGVEGGSCGGCRVDLPVMEYRRVRDEPEDAVVTCVHCGRLFVR